MLFNYTYLLEDFDPVFFDGAGTQAGDFIIPINDLIIGRKPKLFQTLHHSKSKFCFCIPAELTRYSKQFIKEEIILNLVRLLFLPNYLRIKDKHIFFIEKIQAAQKGLNQVYNEFYVELKKQGIAIAMIEIIATDAALEDFSGGQQLSIIYPNLNNYLGSGEHQGSFEVFIEKFTIPANLDKKWIVPVTTLADFENKVKLIEKFERRMKLSGPMQVKLIEMYNDAYQNNERLSSENKLLIFKLEHSAYHLQLVQQKSHELLNEISGLRLDVHQAPRRIFDAERTYSKQESDYSENHDHIIQLQMQISAEQNRAQEILEWYKKEYELLPMWYKRFGQIIKVLLGKRTFISLFE